MDWWDTNSDGHLDAVEIDRYLLDNGLMPGQPDGYWYEADERADDGWDDEEPREPRRSRADDDDAARRARAREAYLSSLAYDYDDYVSQDDDYDDDGCDSSGSATDDGTSHGRSVAQDKKSCYSCLYWCDTYDDWSREDGCRIFDSYVGKNHSEIAGYARPKQDGKTCKEYRPRLEGRTLGCLECKHFGLYDLEYQRATVAADFPSCCDIKGQVKDVAGIAMYKGREFGLWFTAICPRFELGDSRLCNEPEPTEHAWSVKPWKPQRQP